MALPLKPPKKRTINLGDARVTQNEYTFARDVRDWGLNDIHDMITTITLNDVGQEMRAGNDPTTIEVDGQKNKTLQQVERKVIVLFSRAIPRQALEELRSVLIRNIQASTEAKSGKLSDPSSWEFKLIRNGRAISLSGAKEILLQQRDYIILMPKLFYASSVNMRVAGGSKAMDYVPASNSKKGRKPSGKTAKRNQKLGFMAMTARMARGMAAFATFAVTVLNTTRFAVPGERRRYGTAFLRISPRRGMARR